VVILLVPIGGYFIGGYSISAYWWLNLLVVILLVPIGG
jgi:hypothetical protein